MQTRIYVVQHGEERRLVEATSQAQAIRHCVKGAYNATVATTKDLAKMMAAGLSVEVAGNDTSDAAQVANPARETA